MGEKGFSPRNRRTERDNYVRSGEEVTIEGDNEGKNATWSTNRVCMGERTAHEL